MSKPWSVNQPSCNVTQLMTAFHDREDAHQTEGPAKCKVASNPLVRLSPVQKEFWENFQSRRDGRALHSDAFVQVARINQEQVKPLQDRKQHFAFQKGGLK